MIVRTLAPAKINWTLEVLGKRDDGYHEIRSVMQTIDLCDEVVVEEPGARNQEPGWISAGSARLLVEGEHKATEDDLTLRAVRALEEATGRELPVAIRLVKRIPVAAGLGGGSSDAAAVLRAVDRLFSGSIGESKQTQVARQVGSDVPFFLRGGTTAVAGRGEEIKAVLYGRPMWIVLLVPPMYVPEKTKMMYASLSQDDFSDGARTVRLVKSLRALEPDPIEDAHICSAFERAAYEVFDGLARYRDALRGAGASGVHLAGAGPSLFARFGALEDAERVAERLRESDARILVAQTLGAWEATRVVVTGGE